MIQIIVFLIVLSVLVFVHELGHFSFAKWFNVKVNSFAIGFPPTLWKKKVGETEYKLNALPLGGYVALHGELESKDEDSNRTLVAQVWWKQALILLGGILFNIIFAWVVLVILGFSGIPTSIASIDEEVGARDVATIITNIEQGSVAEELGIVPGSLIVQLASLDDESVVTDPQPEAITDFVNTYPDGFAISYQEFFEAPVETIEVVPKFIEEENRYMVGIALDRVGTVSLSFGESIRHATQRMWGIAVLTYESIGRLFTGKESVASVSGPVGLVGIVGQAQEAGFQYLMNITAVISLSLALFNLLPIPALDGGRLVFVIIEVITGKRIPDKVNVWMNTAGFVLLLGLMLVITVFDVMRL